MIPNHDEKYDEPALFSPEQAIEAQDGTVPTVPPAVILGYQTELTEAVRERAGPPIGIVRSQECLPLSESVGYVPVHEAGTGAPVTATVAENAIAAGASAVVMLGGSAALSTDVPPDAAVLPTESIRDEGVSYHYVPPDESLTPTDALVEALGEELGAAGFETPRGRTWTTSAMYRETVAEIERYREEGVLTLCMESAALWAVCRYRGVDTVTVHEIGDYLAPDGWVPEATAERGLVEMLPAVERALANHVDDG